MTAQADVLAGTIAELTWPEIDAAARDDAVLLWAFGVIEQHGPHLPTGTDVYLPSARVRAVSDRLAGHGVRALVMPPYYWGVNVVSAGFPASYQVRPELMRELMADVLDGVARDGFRRVFCFSGHGDALHNRTVHDGVVLGAQRSGIDVAFVTEPALASRIGLADDDPHLALCRPGPLHTAIVDVHAGRHETSLMLAHRPDLVDDDARRNTPPTTFGPAELAQWRRGHDVARRLTPAGHVGDPATASADEGMADADDLADAAVEAILTRLAAQARIR